MKQTIHERVQQLAPDYIKLRHHLHQNPELSYEERETSALVAKRLGELGFSDVQTDVGGYGIVAKLKGSKPGKTIAIRADMDALPIHETSDLPYKSIKPGIMHACGHDGHTSTLLGTAATLAGMKEEMAGEVRFIFQPAEETAGGALKMCAAGAMEGVDEVIALHGWPGMAVGQIGVRSGPMMASADIFDIVIKGKGAHAAMPHASIDPIVIASHVVIGMQSIVSRETMPTDAIVITITRMDAGTAYNIIPVVATLRGTLRCLKDEMRYTVPVQMERMIAGICAAYRAEYEFDFRLGTGVTINDTNVSNKVAVLGVEVLGEANVVHLEAPSMGAEDFAAYLHHAPGAMFRLGTGVENTGLHTPTYNFADGAVPIGMELFARYAWDFLQQK